MTAATVARTRVDATPVTVQYGCFDPAAAPVARVELGEPVELVTVQGATTDDVPPGWLPPQLAAIEAALDVVRGPGPHVVTGPVSIEGVRAGDRVGVRIESVELGACYGFQRLRPGRGVLADEVDELDELIIPFVDGCGILATPAGPVPIPLRPFPGIVAVSPAPAMGSVSTAEPGPHGGNLDCPELVAGSTLYLSAAVDGLGLSVGDGHAAQGEGEVGLTALETSLDVTVTVDAAPSVPATGAPIAVTPAGLVVMGLDLDLDGALHAAVSSTVDVLCAATSLDRISAYRLCSIAAHARIAQAVCAHRCVYLLLPGPVAASLSGRASWLDHESWSDRRDRT